MFDAHSGLQPPADVEPAGPYEQQLKNALISDLKLQIADYVRKHMIPHRTGPLFDVLQYAEKYERCSKVKVQKPTTSETFYSRAPAMSSAPLMAVY